MMFLATRGRRDVDVDDLEETNASSCTWHLDIETMR